ncbi:hypothetical protein Dimus_000798 [Dionaea muscipula]
MTAKQPSDLTRELPFEILPHVPARDHRKEHPQHPGSDTGHTLLPQALDDDPLIRKAFSLSHREGRGTIKKYSWSTIGIGLTRGALGGNPHYFPYGHFFLEYSGTK